LPPTQGAFHIFLHSLRTALFQIQLEAPDKGAAITGQRVAHSLVLVRLATLRRLTELKFKLRLHLNGEKMWYKNSKSVLFRKRSSLILAVLVAAVAVAVFAASSPQVAQADNITPPPPLPPGLAPVPAGHKLFLVGHATGTQNYVCLPSGAGVAYVLFTPEATLFEGDGKQDMTHYFSPNPFEPNMSPKVIAGGTIRPTWQHKDTSKVWAKLHQPNGAVTVDSNAIPWLLLDVVGAQNGPTGGDKLSETTFIQRLNTTGGLAPLIGCASSADVGNSAWVPYTADYFFYKEAN
jgi:hypothetical protein